MGRSFKRNDIVSPQVMSEIPDTRLRSLKNTGMLKEVYEEVDVQDETAQDTPQDATDAPETPQDAPEGDMCEVCGEGPFQRLDRHMAKHQGA